MLRCLIPTFISLSLYSVTFCAIIEKQLGVTLEQQNIFEDFKDKITPSLKENFMKTDTYLLATLRAANFNLATAEEMCNQNLRWRKENQINSILSENFDDLENVIHFSIDNANKQFNPVAKLQISERGLHNAFQSFGDTGRILRYLQMVMERMTTLVVGSQNLGLNISQWSLVANFDTFTNQTNGRKTCEFLWMNLLTGMQNLYTGFLEELVIFEVPSYVESIADIMACYSTAAPDVKITIFGGKQQYKSSDMKGNLGGCGSFLDTLKLGFIGKENLY